MESFPRAFVAPATRLFALLLVAGSSLFAAHAQTKALLPANDSYLSPFEREVLQEVNLVRANPAAYVAYLEQLRPYFKGNTFQPPGHPALVTEEGVKALDEAVRHLRAARALPAFALSKGMCMGALEHVRNQGPSGQMGHKGTDGSLCEQRLERFGSWQMSVGENLSYGTETARERVLTWLIDDGFADRGHRNSILSRTYKVVGVSCGNHSQMGTMCVLTFAGGFDERAAGAAPAVNKMKMQKAARQF